MDELEFRKLLIIMSQEETVTDQSWNMTQF